MYICSWAYSKFFILKGYGDTENEFSDEALSVRSGGNFSYDENSLELRSGINVRRINNRDSAIYKCSGSLINRRYVLTAAHCHSKENPVKYVVVGDHDLDKDPDCDNGCPKAQVFRPDGNIIIHENFNDDTLENDIALIRLRIVFEKACGFVSEKKDPCCSQDFIYFGNIFCKSAKISNFLEQ